MNKELKKEYDKKLGKITLRLSKEEKAVLFRKMEEDDWTNVAGFIKFRLFGASVKGAYSRMKKSGKEEDIRQVMKVLFEEMVNQLGYLNYRFNYELDKLHSEHGKIDAATAKKITATLSLWRKNVTDRTDGLCEDCRDILQRLNIPVEKRNIEDIKYAPESVIEKAAKDWHDVSSPEAEEATRRVVEKFKKDQAEALKKRDEK